MKYDKFLNLDITKVVEYFIGNGQYNFPKKFNAFIRDAERISDDDASA